MNNSSQVHHWLHACFPNQSRIDRIDSESVNVRLSHLGQELPSLRLPIDKRVRQTIIAVDGTLFRESLPRGSKVVTTVPLGWIACRQEDFIGQWETFCGVPEIYLEPASQEQETGARIWMELYRHVLLMPKGVAAFRRYNSRTFKPQIVLIDVGNKRHPDTVDWIAT